MYYCFSCGGRLPESSRAENFLTPDEGERAQATRLLAEAATIEDVCRILGRPDNIYEWEAWQRTTTRDVLVWKRTLRYSTRWKTLVLDVQELPDGSIHYLVFGQYVGADKRSGQSTRPE
jgi:hypothetical protein